MVAVHVIILLVLSLITAKYLKGSFPSFWVLFGILLKISSGIVLGWIYKEYLAGGDTFNHFSQSLVYVSDDATRNKILSDIFSGRFNWYYGENRSNFFSLLLTPVVYISNGSYWISTCYLALLSFWGIWFFIKTVATHYPSLDRLAMFSFLFLPSSLIWTSGFLKESVIYPLICVILAVIIIVDIRRKLSVSQSICFASSLFLILIIKFYVFAGLAVSIIFLLIWRISDRYSEWQTRTVVYMMLILFVLLLPKLHPYLTYERLPLTIYENYREIIQNTSKQENIIDIGLQPDYLSLLANIPEAFLLGMIRPLFFSGSTETLLFSIENLLIVIGLLLSGYFIMKKSTPNSPLIIAAVLYIVTMSLIIGFTTPNIGTLYRYKVVYGPILIFMTYIIPHKELLVKNSSN